ncbi:ATP-dependent nuclease [Psychroflexus planctonicus]|uniref:ATP-dependent endonuclease of the OLD family n=1 Tax=Psychroflexus planctonicus TaxID=1526575 RepID=A0ABQ1SCS3_9FLAO|nr:AAA family ATPase [Psychroflexus planctonicus]GGE28874.1 hypothetical protein GCM10010832_06890 [Psychroflexus planctonicus]
MKIHKLKIHNFRSIKDGEFYFDDYSLLIGENNAGKSNVFRAIRIFYEELKFNSNSDFPKFQTDDNESWLEIEFLTDDEEQNTLRDKYQSSDNILRVRKILTTENTDFKPLIKANQSNIFAYEKGSLSTNYFYGAKNISQSKLGSIIYIPEISKVDDNLKLSGPSPLREMINFVVKKAIQKSISFEKLNGAFELFNNEFRTEAKEDFSIEELENDINKEIKNWNIKFGLNINAIQPNDIVRNLVSHHIQDGNLENQTVAIDSFGQGVQRHLIYTLLKLSAKYTENIEKKNKKEFSPNLTLILFEEPEAFLHPSQQEKLNISLKELSLGDSQQILITTHSPLFVSKNIDNLNTLIKVNRKETTELHQLKKENILSLTDANIGLFKHFKDKLLSNEVDDELKKKIRKKKLSHEEHDDIEQIEKERFKFSLWMDSERTSLFFAKKVLICEGASEKIFFDYLINNKWHDLKDEHLYILDCLGKFNVHRFMNLFNHLGIEHSIIIDSDDNDIQEIVNSFIESKTNSYTNKIDYFENDLESFLEIDKPKRRDLKPLNIMQKFNNGEIKENKLSELNKKIKGLFK